jgi:hypothetical protein
MHHPATLVLHAQRYRKVRSRDLREAVPPGSHVCRGAPEWNLNVVGESEEPRPGGVSVNEASRGLPQRGIRVAPPHRCTPPRPKPSMSRSFFR